MAAEDSEPEAYFSAEEEGGERNDNASDEVEGVDEKSDREGAAANNDEEKLIEKLTPDQWKELVEVARKAKEEGNEHYKNGDFTTAIECYSSALQSYPKSCDPERGSCDHERAVCYANRGACYMKKERHEEVVDDCTEALKLEPDYLKALLRRSQSYEELEKYEDALQDYQKILELDPTQTRARQAVMYLPDKVKEQHEKLKTEMLGKLKELGNAVLNPFGLSTDNFQLQQDPNSGGYSINFKR